MERVHCIISEISNTEVTVCQGLKCKSTDILSKEKSYQHFCHTNQICFSTNNASENLYYNIKNDT